jgi:hypothetical protein
MYRAWEAGSLGYCNIRKLLLRLHDGKQATKGKPVPNVSGESIRLSNPAV